MNINQPTHLNDCLTRGNSYWQKGQIALAASTSIAQPGHSIFLDMIENE